MMQEEGSQVEERQIRLATETAPALDAGPSFRWIRRIRRRCRSETPQ